MFILLIMLFLNKNDWLTNSLYVFSELILFLSFSFYSIIFLPIFFFFSILFSTNLCYCNFLIVLMIAAQKIEDISHHFQLEQYKREFPFDTQMSQQPQPHAEQKGFTPWIKQKPIIHHQYSPQQIDYHRFLAKIRLSPRNKNRFNKDENPETEKDLQMIKADLSFKIKAEKISNEYHEDRGRVHSTQTKNFFQRRTNFAKLYRRPKSIDLSLDFQPQSMLKCSPIVQNSLDFYNSNKRQLKIIHKLRKKKSDAEEQKKFATTMNDFRINIITAQKKVYQTLQLNFESTTTNLKKLVKPGQNEVDSGTFKTVSLFNRQKLQKPKNSKQTIEIGNNLACLGKNALISFGHKSCRQKIKDQNKVSAKSSEIESFII